MQRRNGTALLLLLVALGIQATACGYSAPAEGEGDEPATVEPIEDSDLSRVVLTADAAKRLGLETAPVVVSNVESTDVVRGRVAADPAGPRSLLISVSLPAAELAKVDVSKPARVLEVFGSDGLVAPMVGSAASGSTLTYRLDGAGQVVHAGEQVRVELQLAGGGEQKTIPYSAVIYGIEGGVWTYTTTGPLTFVRAPITVASLQGNVAVLSKGPDPGTEVVTVGGGELLGTEFAIEGE
jgi:hypothetical protein